VLNPAFINIVVL